jgi:hypothetical protein
VRAVSEVVAAQAVFVAGVNDGRPWREAMRAWNKAHKEKTYSESRLFARDCRSAYERVTGRQLVWDGPRGKSALPHPDKRRER